MPGLLCNDCNDPPDNDNDQEHHASTGRYREGKLCHCIRNLVIDSHSKRSLVSDNIYV